MSDNVRSLRPVKKPTYIKIEPALYLHSVSGVYYVRKSFKHLRIPELFESLRTDKITAARREVQRKIEGHKARYLGGKTVTSRDERAGTTIGTVIDEILVTYTPKKRARTQDKHVFYFGEIKAEWGAIDVNRLTLIMWERWLPEFKARKKRRKTFDDYAITMNIVLNYAHKHRYLTHPISMPMSDPKSKAGRLYTDAELAALWEVMNDDLRDQFVLAFECFMRLREVLFLTWERIDLQTGKLTLRAEDVKTGSKTGKGRTFFVSAKALERLRAIKAKQTEETAFVFPAPGRAGQPRNQNKNSWAAAKKKAKIKGRARWHDIRHTSLTKALLEHGLNPVQVSEYSGVSLRTIQRVYLHSNEELTRAIAGALNIQTISNQTEGVKKA